MFALVKASRVASEEPKILVWHRARGCGPLIYHDKTLRCELKQIDSGIEEDTLMHFYVDADKNMAEGSIEHFKDINLQATD